MQIGVLLPNGGGLAGAGGVERCLALAAAAEAHGFASIWLGDRVVVPAGLDRRLPGGDAGAPPLPPDEEILEPLVLLSALAQRTERVLLGLSALVLPYRHPLMVAKMLATADQLSGGRVILGAVAGWAEPEFA